MKHGKWEKFKALEGHHRTYWVFSGNIAEYDMECRKEADRFFKKGFRNLRSRIGWVVDDLLYFELDNPDEVNATLVRAVYYAGE